MKDFSSDCGFISEPNVVEYDSTSMAERFFGNENQNLPTLTTAMRSKIFGLLGVEKFSCDCPGHSAHIQSRVRGCAV
jgi:hypothetical protein